MEKFFFTTLFTMMISFLTASSSVYGFSSEGFFGHKKSSQRKKAKKNKNKSLESSKHSVYEEEKLPQKSSCLPCQDRGPF